MKESETLPATLFQDLAPADREAMLEANCLRPEEQDVKKPFSAEELIDMRKQYLDNSIFVKQKTEAFKKVETTYKDEIKPKVEDNAYLLGNIRAGYVEVRQQVYLFDDQQEGMMKTYGADGVLIESRRLLPEERQLRVK